MSAGAFHASGLTREPPPHNSPVLLDVRAYQENYSDGRIGWPTIVQYEYAGKFNDVPPTEHGIGFQVAVHDVSRYDALRASGVLHDPRHTGFQISEIVEKSK